MKYTVVLISLLLILFLLINKTLYEEDEQELCPPHFWGNVAHPDRCDAYYMCFAGTALLVPCTAGTKFNEELQTCVTCETLNDEQNKCNCV